MRNSCAERSRLQQNTLCAGAHPAEILFILNKMKRGYVLYPPQSVTIPLFLITQRCTVLKQQEQRLSCPEHEHLSRSA